MRDLSAWLHYLETLHPKAIDLGLDRVRIVAQRLNLLPFVYPVITVAGTNGKGSTVATLEAVYTAANYRVASYTSPHLLVFNERIKINQQNVDDTLLCAAFTEIEKVRAEVSLTYFEFSTLAALWIFAQQPLDIVILEVGMGGRLDAVNIADPMISVITSVDLDHTEYLGNTREEIAAEKAGIFRRHTDVVCGDKNPPVTLLEKARNLSTPICLVNQDFSYKIEEDTWSWRNAEVCCSGLPLGTLWIPNMATALAVIMKMQKQFPVSLNAICHGIARAQVMGRFQKLHDHPLVIADVAHNPAGVAHLVQRLQEQVVTGETWLVFSMLRDKDISGALAILLDMVDHWMIAPLSSERGTSAEMLVQILHDNHVAEEKIKQFASIKDAYIAALQLAQAQDRIVVTGSFYTVGEIPLVETRFIAS